MLEFFRDERGLVPYSLLGISMLLIVGVAIYHFSNVDILKAEERNVLTFDMETFYSTARIAQDLQQAARASAKNAILDHSTLTYSKPVDIDTEWEGRESFNIWKLALENDISEKTKTGIYDFYFGGNKTALEKQYYSSVTAFDFSEFIVPGGIEVGIVQDRYNPLEKVQMPLELKVSFSDGGALSAKNRFTGYELSMDAGTSVISNPRPFTMAEKAYSFTQTFNSKDLAEEASWHLWGMQEVLGLFEANVKHRVKFATDARASYSLAHLLIAYRELEEFGTFDYVHTTLEFLRPWAGKEGEGTMFLSLFKESIEEGYVDLAIESMDSARFIGELGERVGGISDEIITASASIDIDTVTPPKGVFESSEIEGLVPLEDGTKQHLKRAEDIKRLDDVQSEIEKSKNIVANAKLSVTSGAVNSLNVGAQLPPLELEWSEVRGEVQKAQEKFKTSRAAIKSARTGYSELSSYIDSEKCNSPIAAMLWFGDINQSVKGLGSILKAKTEETYELDRYYSTLEEALGALEYKDDAYGIDAHYKSARDALESSRENLKKARVARVDYYYWMNKYGLCHSYTCSTGRGDPISCYPDEVAECIKDVEWEAVDCFCEETEFGDEICYTCYNIYYECTCKDEYAQNARKAEEIYKEQMALAEQNLGTSAGEVRALKTQIDSFFTEMGLRDAYAMIEKVHGGNEAPSKRPLEQEDLYSISDIYYGHWNYSFCEEGSMGAFKRYECAKALVPDPPPSMDDTNYANDMPKSPLTYDAAHKDHGDYGLYYIKYVIDRMGETFSGDSIGSGALEEGRNTLVDMKSKGIFKSFLTILGPVSELIDTAGDIKSAVGTLKNAEEKFPSIEEHFYTTLPLPPINGTKMGFENQGFSVIHDIRLRADTRPGEIKIPVINKVVTLGGKGQINPSLPIPYTPINVYLWGFSVVPSMVGSDEKGSFEPSTLWLMDTENLQIAPLMEMRTEEKNKISAPFLLHKPIMYKYTFTPKETIGKGLDMLPPVFILSAGPFTTTFGPHVEPPDRRITDKPLAVTVSFESEFSNESAVLTVSSKEKGAHIKTRITEVGSQNSLMLSDEMMEVILKENLSFLSDYGWSEVKADSYVNLGPEKDSSYGEYGGEDHASVYFIDPSLTAVGITLEKENDGSKLKIVSTGNRKVDVSINALSKESCTFILSEGRITKNWIGSVGPDMPAELEIISEGSTKITAKVLMPEKVKKELERRGIPLALEAEI